MTVHFGRILHSFKQLWKKQLQNHAIWHTEVRLQDL